MLVFKVATLLLVLGPAIAQITIPPDVIFEPDQPVCVRLEFDMYTRVLVREETSVKIDCSFVRSRFITQNSITDESRVTVRWLFAAQLPNLMDFMRPAGPLVAAGRTTIVGVFMEIVNNTGVRLPTLAVDGTTGEYTCEVCSDRDTPTETCTNSTVPIVGRRFPPVINEGEPNAMCEVQPIFRIVTCNVGTNYCIPPGATGTIQLLCQHSPPPIPVTPEPQIGVWFLDGVQISSSDDGSALPAAPNTVTITSQGQRLTITNPGAATRGNYTCMLTNIAGSDVATTLITDCVPPVLRPPRRDDPSTIQIGLTPHCLTTPQTTILCEVQSGSPVIMYSWTRNGMTLPETSNSLNVTTVGQYQCTATNPYGSDMATTQIAVGAMITFSGSINGRTDNGCSRITAPTRMPDICVLIGETLQFVCNIVGEIGSAPQITNPGGMTAGSPLTVNNVQPTSDGMFQCSSSTTQCGATNMTIDVQVFSPGSPPMIDVTPTLAPGPPTIPDPDNIINIGAKACIPANGNVRINCNTLSGTTPLTYQWRRNTLLITNPNPPESLVVTEAGLYMCTVSNRFGSDSATSELQVTPGSVNFQITSNGPIDCSRLNPVPPNIDRCPRFARVEFQCTSNQGLPTMITYNGAPFNGDPIDPFGTANNGLYSCSASTSCGTAFSNLTVRAFQPAEVDINVPLPPPDVSGSIPGGAGRGPVDVPVGGNVTLFCPTTGVDIPMTRWEINGVTVVSMPPRIIVGETTENGQVFLTLTITNVSASDQITYTCVTVNADGTDSRMVTVREPPRNEWCLGTWTACNPDCHRGTRNRTVVCKDNARRVLSDLGCSPPKPDQTATCDTRGPCFLSPVWRPGPWSQCSRQCGTGSQTRRVDCIIPRTNTVVDSGQCVHIVRPKSYQLCNTQDCCSDTYPSLCRLVGGSTLCNMQIFRQVCCWTCGAS